MSNWFEDHPVRSVIAHTFLVSGVTWAASTFIFQDNRLNLVRSEVESQKAVAEQQKAIAEQYKAKVELLQREVDVVRSENAEYRAWLSQAKDAIPVIVPRINQLKLRVEELERNNSQLQSTSTEGFANNEIQVTRGRAFVDDETGIVVTVLRVTVERMATVAVKLPGQSFAKSVSVHAGEQWKFDLKGKSYVLTLMEVNFYTDTIRIRLASTTKP